MTGVTTWNKGTVPAGTDGWSLRPNLQLLREGVNDIVPVNSQAERDALAPPTGKYPGMCVVRNDVPGAPIERWDGAAWRRGPRFNIGQGANDPSHDSGVATVTTNANGDFTVNLPTPFGSTLVSYQLGDATDPATLGAILLKHTDGSSDRTKLTGRAYTTAGAALANVAIAINWSADGY